MRQFGGHEGRRRDQRRISRGEREVEEEEGWKKRRLIEKEEEEEEKEEEEEERNHSPCSYFIVKE